jgi:hypothetical protein
MASAPLGAAVLLAACASDRLRGACAPENPPYLTIYVDEMLLPKVKDFNVVTKGPACTQVACIERNANSQCTVWRGEMITADGGECSITLGPYRAKVASGQGCSNPIRPGGWIVTFGPFGQVTTSLPKYTDGMEGL